MKKRLSNECGVTILTVTLTIIVMLVILSVLTFYISNSVAMEQFQNMRADISEIEAKALTYYIENGALPVYSDRKTKSEMSGDSEFFNPNDGDDYAKVNLDLLGVVPAYDTDYYINTESLTVYAAKTISLKAKEYPRPVEKFDKLLVEGQNIPEWEEECFENIDVISNMFEYDSKGVIIGLNTEYCKSSNPEYYSDIQHWKKLVIPATQPSGELVTGIATGAFDDISEISGIVKIPSTIQNLSEGCFSGKNLKYVYCDAQNIDIGAFRGCQLEEVHIGPNSLIPDGSKDGSTYVGLFYGMSNLKKVWIDCTAIGKYAFAECRSMQLIVLSDNVKRISDYAFWNCMNNRITILRSDEIASSLDNSYWPISGTYTEGSISFSNRLEEIGVSAFNSDSLLSGSVDFTNCSNLAKIGANAFYGTGITSVKIADGVAYENNSFPANASIRN